MRSRSFAPCWRFARICRIRTLDSFGLDPFFAKIDVQGSELRVLMGGQETIARNRPVLLIEWPEPEVSDWLTERGYVPYAFDAQAQSFRRGQNELLVECVLETPGGGFGFYLQAVDPLGALEFGPGS